MNGLHAAALRHHASNSAQRAALTIVSASLRVATTKTAPADLTCLEAGNI